MKNKGLILITGATGYIGSHTVVELINAGYDVVGVDNFYNSTAKVLDGIKKIVGFNIKFEEIDCSDYKAFENVFVKYPDIVGAIHFAACKAVGESIEKPLLYYRNNIVSLLNLIDLINKKAKQPNIVFSSSCTVYGQPAKKYLPIPETAPLIKSPSPYGKSKQMAEDILSDSIVAFPKLKVCALRYFNPIGAHPTAYIGELPNGVPMNLVPFITQTAAGIRDHLNVFGDDYNTPDGSCIRDYIYVVDLAKAHVKALDKLLGEESAAEKTVVKKTVVAKDSPYPAAEASGRWFVYNLGTGKGLSVLQLVKGFIKATGVKLNYVIAPRRTGDVEQVWADPSKAKKELGWKAATPIGEVLKSAWKWQQTLPKQ
ncbi:MAG: UDP-glucose 4-epimerase GalE [Bacteroidales bacterium]|nr:UDP-glucose 4-epimerase GalE [Bacteroidales bacterium]MDD3910789.1 UDP-glucose 4-epimerase GalE [Bacteroidales bacterium]MDD4421204.1 UDP-glucose 4-epimerase GalE [Bacteroidales bacterium]